MRASNFLLLRKANEMCCCGYTGIQGGAKLFYTDRKESSAGPDHSRSKWHTMQNEFDIPGLMSATILE